MQRQLPTPTAAIAGNMLDSRLAEPYRVPTSRLNQAIKRNRLRIPEDFMFRLVKEEAQSCRGGPHKWSIGFMAQRR